MEWEVINKRRGKESIVSLLVRICIGLKNIWERLGIWGFGRGRRLRWWRRG
jgi:hypothetical protein